MRGEFSLGGNLLLYRRRIVVPKALQKVTLQKIHAGHQAILQFGPGWGGQRSHLTLSSRTLFLAIWRESADVI